MSTSATMVFILWRMIFCREENPLLHAGFLRIWPACGRENCLGGSPDYFLDRCRPDEHHFCIPGLAGGLEVELEFEWLGELLLDPVVREPDPPSFMASKTDMP